MVLAMHHSQVACLVDHAGGIAWLEALLGRVGRDGLLLASVTSEVGVGGKMRTSHCAVEPAGDGRFTLEKRASSISYGAYADVFLATARANPSAGESDQVLVVVPAAPEVLSRTGGWNSMGMRGTCSEAFVVRASGGMDQIIPVGFARIAAETMVPVSHLLWSSVWCGIAADAVGRARAYLRAKIRAGGSPSTDGANHLVRATERLLAVEALVKQALAGHESVGPGASFAAAAGLNMLKTGVSDACLAIVEEALLVCGFAGYSNEGPYSLSRHVRDIHSARLMIHNDRVRDNTAHLLMLQAPALGLS
jgi:acyl-CoA dehydrogenase